MVLIINTGTEQLSHLKMFPQWCVVGRKEETSDGSLVEGGVGSGEFGQGDGEEDDQETTQLVVLVRTHRLLSR